jgi:hypothetical protein
MGLIADLLPLLRAAEVELPLAYGEALAAHNEPELLSALNELEHELLPSAAIELEAVSSTLATLDSAPDDPDKLDAAIEEAARAIGRMERDLKRFRTLAQRLESDATCARSPTLPKLRSINERLVRQFSEMHDRTEQIYVQLTALRASGDPPVAGPVLSSPAQVRDFFRSLRA